MQLDLPEPEPEFHSQAMLCLVLLKKKESLQKYLESVFGTDTIKFSDAIDATLNIDGHMLSRQIAPYMAKDLDWDGI